MPEPLHHRNQGRTMRTFLALCLALGVLAFLHSVGTVTWVLVVLALFAVPAAVDVIRNPQTEFALTDDRLTWKNGGQTADLPLSRIERVRFDTRWDFSVRATLILVDRSKLRVPQDVMPPHQRLEDALKERNVLTERHHFRVI